MFLLRTVFKTPTKQGTRMGMSKNGIIQVFPTPTTLPFLYETCKWTSYSYRTSHTHVQVKAMFPTVTPEVHYFSIKKGYCPKLQPKNYITNLIYVGYIYEPEHTRMASPTLTNLRWLAKFYLNLKIKKVFCVGGVMGKRGACMRWEPGVQPVYLISHHISNLRFGSHFLINSKIFIFSPVISRLGADPSR